MWVYTLDRVLVHRRSCGNEGIDSVEPHFISEKNKEKLQNKKANGWRVMPYSTA